jgi:hypothetical protein
MEGITVYRPVIWCPAEVLSVVLASASSPVLADGAGGASVTTTVAPLGAGGAR